MFSLQSNVFNSVFAESRKDTTRAICKPVGTPADQQTRTSTAGFTGNRGTC